MTSAAVQLDEESLIREQIAQIDLPDGVRFKRIVDGFEWTGEPAWHIYFAVSKQIPLTKRFMQRLGAIRNDLDARIFRLQSGKWPFVHFEESK
jgi:hypothetical protein